MFYFFLLLWTLFLPVLGTSRLWQQTQGHPTRVRDNDCSSIFHRVTLQAPSSSWAWFQNYGFKISVCDAQKSACFTSPSPSPCSLSGKESTLNVGDLGSIPGLGRDPGGEHVNELQYSCLKNPMDRGAWWGAVHGVTKSRTWLKWLSIQTWTAAFNYWLLPLV